MGKPVQEAPTIDIPGAGAVWRYYAEALDKIADEIAPTGEIHSDAYRNPG
jgi:gamma-glutamyl-gamma-aminobutyraldehyde dehydrogenase